MASEGLHEPIERLSEETLDLHRAIVSLMEEFEAVDWYQQRADATADDDLRAVLAHNRDEEIEHAVMTLEWLRRRLPALDRNLREFLFKDGPITGNHTNGQDAPPERTPGDLGIRGNTD
ncbi:MAG: encapsulin-associated ferritin-like protein [Minwuia sp.]|uniref:encapsulin-associated ferritin-like protein n=1 Tax=Minwuia sp. TaxID=2493630 RepID=UPI003A86333F